MKKIHEGKKTIFIFTIFKILDPIWYGMFFCALIFDFVYFFNYDVSWSKTSSWLLLIGLFIAIIPRLINLYWVCIVWKKSKISLVHLDFFLNLFAIISAVINCFVHGRDAFAIAPDNIILSSLTVLLLVVAKIVESHLIIGKSYVFKYFQ